MLYYSRYTVQIVPARVQARVGVLGVGRSGVLVWEKG